MLKKRILSVAIPSLIALHGCGSDSTNTAEINTTQFIDSAVQGLDYDCGATSGKTSKNGDFLFEEGALCEFYVNNLSLGSAAPKIGSVITPYDVAEDADQAIKIASLLQSIDADGNPDNGINTEEFEENLEPDLLELSDTEFMEEMEKVVEDPVPLSDAKKHLDKNIPEEQKKGYHSAAVQAVIDNLKLILPQIETIDYESKLSEYKAMLEAGDDSNNADIDSLLALIELAEILNHPQVENRLQFEYEASAPYYTMLPKAIDYAINGTPRMIIDKTMDSSIGSTDADAELLFNLAERLVAVSNKLAFSFTEEDRLAEYDKDGNYNLSYNDAHAARVVALSAANILSTAAAYQYGSDELYLTEAESLNVPIVVETVMWGATEDFHMYEEITESVVAEYVPGGTFPVEVFSDNLDVLTHRYNNINESKYLNLALRSLKEAVSVAANTVDLDKLNKELELPLESDELASLKFELSEMDSHLDGKSESYLYSDKGYNAEINILNFYDVNIGLDRTDMINIVNEYSEVIDVELSKALGHPAKAQPYESDMNWYVGVWLYSEVIDVLLPPYIAGYKQYYLAANRVEHIFTYDLGNDLNKIVLSCSKDEKPCDL